MNLDDILAMARPPETTVDLCLRGDLGQRVGELEEELAGLEDDGSLAGPSAQARELAEEIERLRAEMAESTVTFRFRGLPRTEYAALLKDHKPRKELDEIDVNWDTFPSAIIQASCVDPALDASGVEKLAGAVTHAQWDALFAAAWRVNRLRVDVPKSGRASEILKASTGQKSKPPEPGA